MDEAEIIVRKLKPTCPVKVVLKCPECGHEFEFFSNDFESDVNCKKCGYWNDAWFFWHKPHPKIWEPEEPIVDVWTIGAHYPNDALLLDDATFLEFFFGRKTFPWHGGSPYIWVKIIRRRNGSLYASVKVLVNMFLPMYSNTVLETAKKLLAKFQKFYKFT